MYFIDKSDHIKPDRQSTTLIEICKAKEACWRDNLACWTNTETTYSNYLKYLNDYTLLSHNVTEEFTYSIGVLREGERDWPKIDRSVLGRKDLISVELN